MIVAAGPGRGRRGAAGSARGSAHFDRHSGRRRRPARARREPGARRTCVILSCAPSVRLAARLGSCSSSGSRWSARTTVPVLARFTSGEPALVDCASGEGHALVIASDLDNRGNDFPAARHLRPVPARIAAIPGRAASSESAEYLVADVPAGVAAVPGVAATPGRAGVQAGSGQCRSGRNRSRAADAESFRGAVATLGRRGPGRCAAAGTGARRTAAHLAICAGGDAGDDGRGKLGGDKDRLRQMSEQFGPIQELLDRVRARWRRLVLLQVTTRGGARRRAGDRACARAVARGCRARRSPSRCSASAALSPAVARARLGRLAGAACPVRPRRRPLHRRADASLDERLVSAVDVATTRDAGRSSGAGRRDDSRRGEGGRGASTPR